MFSSFVYQFDREKTWCEKLVNISHTNPKKTFEFTLSQGENENVQKILKPNQLFSSGFCLNKKRLFTHSSFELFIKEVLKTLKSGDSLEISPRSLVLMNSLSELISKTNGAILIIDYGENQSFSNSIRVFRFSIVKCHNFLIDQAIRNHKFLDNEVFLDFPGECDLSAYVNFMSLATAAKKVPGSQCFFLIISMKFFFISQSRRTHASRPFSGIHGNEHQTRCYLYKKFKENPKFSYIRCQLKTQGLISGKDWKANIRDQSFQRKWARFTRFFMWEKKKTVSFIENLKKKRFFLM